MEPLTDRRDRRILQLYEQLLEIEQRLIPTGLHILGEPRHGELRDILRLIASFDRPEQQITSLPELIASSLRLTSYELLVKQSGDDPLRLAERERVEELTSAAIDDYVASGREIAAARLSESCGVPVAASSKVFDLLESVRRRLQECDEIGAIARALRGEYIEPGPGADVIQNPDILPTGRNTYAVNPYYIPSRTAFTRAESTVVSLLERHEREAGRYPESIAMVLWGLDNIKTQGEAVAQALWLLGVSPKRDNLNRVVQVEAIPLEKLGRPRIDLVLTISGIFRDLFAPTIELLDKAVRLVASLNEPEERNFVRRHAKDAIDAGVSPDDAVVRIFSNAPGNYGTNVNFMVMDSQWDGSHTLGDLFVTRKCFAYGRDERGRSFDGREARELMERALSGVEVTYQNIDTVEVGITDVDHYFEYLGGVSKAVETRAGTRPKIYLSDALAPGAKIRSLEETVRLETRTKTLNPKWYEAMLSHGYRGVAEIEHHVTNTFGWSATANAVDNWIYEDVAKTFVLDEEMLERLRRLNPHSARGLVGRLLEAQGRGFWQASDEVIEKLRDAVAGIEDQLEGITA